MNTRLLSGVSVLVAGIMFGLTSEASATQRRALDTQAPLVSFTSPSAGATVSGTLTMSGSASDNVKLSTVEVKVDSGNYQLATGTSAWTLSIDTRAYTNGSHTLTVRATDSSANKAWAGRTITITNGAAKVYWGAMLKGATYTHLYGGSWGDAPWDSNTWSRFESNAGKRVSVVHWGMNQPPWVKDFNWWTPSLNLVRNAGDLNAVDMSTGSVPLRDIANGLYDSSLRKWVQQAAAWGHPFFLILDVEMNGTWGPYSPGVNGNTAADFVNMWRRFHDLAVQAGATNITWVWAPNIDPRHIFTPYGQLYPGDSYVDWTGLDGFNKDGKSTFSWLYSSSYSSLLQMAPTKPIMITQVGSVEGGIGKAAWITDALATQLPQNFPKIKALLWFNWRIYEQGSWWNWQIESSSSAQTAFKTAISSSYYTPGGPFGNLPLRSKIKPL